MTPSLDQLKLLVSGPQIVLLILLLFAAVSAIMNGKSERPLALWVTGVAYLLVMLIAAITIAVRVRANPYTTTRGVNYLATVDLPANTRVVDEDLKKPEHLPAGYFWRLPEKRELVGRYVKAGLKRGEDVSPANLLASPELPKADTVFIDVSDSVIASFLDAGATVAVCLSQDDNTCISPVIVRAVICDATPRCHVALPVGKAAAITAKHKTLKLISLP